MMVSDTRQSRTLLVNALALFINGGAILLIWAIFGPSLFQGFYPSPFELLILLYCAYLIAALVLWNLFRVLRQVVRQVAGRR